MLVNDVNPYEAGPGVLPGAFADQVAWVWRFTPAPYGPLSLRLQELIVVASGLQPYLSAVLMRIPALIGVVLIVVPVSYTHLRAHETRHDLVCRLLLEKKKKKK